MKRPAREQARRRVDQALEVLRGALAEYFAALPRTRRTAFRDFDLQRLLKAFIEHFGETPLGLARKDLGVCRKGGTQRSRPLHGIPDAGLGSSSPFDLASTARSSRSRTGVR